jgi:hypothetical protein
MASSGFYWDHSVVTGLTSLETKATHVRFLAVMAMTMKFILFRDLTPCSLVDIYQGHLVEPAASLLRVENQTFLS